MSTQLLNSYVHKTVEHRRKAASLKLLTSQSLFSSSTVDVGTNLLWRVIAAKATRKFETCLDLGCGYGALGLALIAAGTVTNVEMVDRDALAVDFSNLNAIENQLGNVEAHSSLGMDDALQSHYDIMVSNLPGKVGSGVLQHLLQAASNHLAQDGEFWGVVVNPLWPEIESMVDDLDVTIVHVEHGPRHTAFGFRRQNPMTTPEVVDSLAEIYVRDTVEFAVAGRNYTVKTSRGVHEFDGLGYSTKLLLKQLYEMRRDRWAEAAVFNVSQGYVPIALRATRMVSAVQLVDRDLLALRTSARNLELNGMNDPANETHHQVDWLPGGQDKEFGLVVGILRGDEPGQAIEIGVESICERLKVGGTAVIAGGSTPLTRMLKALDRRKEVQLLSRNRYRGTSVVSLGKVK